MIEIFKTNLENPDDAKRVINQLGEIFPDFIITFDLYDCDRIMRVKNEKGKVDSENIIALLRDSGFNAEVLEGEFGI